MHSVARMQSLSILKQDVYIVITLVYKVNFYSIFSGMVKKKCKKLSIFISAFMLCMCVM
jgi:hypothetical protein